MKTLGMTATLAVILGGSAGSAAADPDKDESGKGRWRGGYECSYGYPDYDRPRGPAYGDRRSNQKVVLETYRHLWQEWDGIIRS